MVSRRQDVFGSTHRCDSGDIGRVEMNSITLSFLAALGAAAAFGVWKRSVSAPYFLFLSYISIVSLVHAVVEFFK